MSCNAQAFAEGGRSFLASFSPVKYTAGSQSADTEARGSEYLFYGRRTKVKAVERSVRSYSFVYSSLPTYDLTLFELCLPNLPLFSALVVSFYSKFILLFPPFYSIHTNPLPLATLPCSPVFRKTKGPKIFRHCEG